MASLVSRLWMKLYRKRPAISIMIVGLDNSGKTSILNKLATLNQPASQQDPQQHHHTPAGGKASSSSSAPLKRGGTSVIGQPDIDNVTPTVGYNYERIQYKELTFIALDFSGQNRYRNLWQEFYNCVDAIVFVIDSSDLIRLVVVRDELETLLGHPYFGTLPGDDGQGDLPANHGNSDRQLTTPNPVGAQKQITLTQGKLVQSPLDQSTLSLASSILAPNNSGQPASATGRSRRRVKIPILFLANKSDLANSVDIEVIVRALNLNQLPKSRHPWSIQATSVASPSDGIAQGFDWLISQLSATLQS